MDCHGVFHFLCYYLYHFLHLFVLVNNHFRVSPGLPVISRYIIFTTAFCVVFCIMKMWLIKSLLFLYYRICTLYSESGDHVMNHEPSPFLFHPLHLLSLYRPTVGVVGGRVWVGGYKYKYMVSVRNRRILFETCVCSAHPRKASLHYKTQLNWLI